MATAALIVVFAIIVYPLAFAIYYSLRKVHDNLVRQFVREVDSKRPLDR